LVVVILHLICTQKALPAKDEEGSRGATLLRRRATDVRDSLCGAIPGANR
jgi:hypothetical protein